MDLLFSIIIPVYNRPDELSELLESLSKQYYDGDFEVVVVEDGSEIPSEDVVRKYRESIHIKYLRKDNTGPGLSRNFGMSNASGNYFIILDSDVILPPSYLQTVSSELSADYADAYTGPDRAHPDFTPFQKAVSYAMTSFLSTGGLRGHAKNKTVQTRSYNMGISKKAFLATGGFDTRRTGEDIALSFRLRHNGFDIRYLEDAVVYHKRRNTAGSFFRQTYSFGKARARLMREQGMYGITYYFPLLFSIFFILALVLMPVFPVLIALYGLYAVSIFIDSSLKNRDVITGLLSIWCVWIQFAGYGSGLLSGFVSSAHNRT